METIDSVQTLESTHKIVRGAFWLYVGTGLTFLLSLLTSIVLARMLGKELWGIFAVCITVSSFLTSLADLGLTTTITYYVSRFSREEFKGKLKRYLTILLKYKLLIILGTGLLMFVFADPLAESFHVSQGGIYFKVTALFFVISNGSTVLDQVFVGLQWFKQSTLTSFVGNLLKLLLPALFVFIGFGVNGALVGYTASLVVVTVLQTYLLRHILSYKESDTETVNVGGLFTFGFFMGVAQVALTLALWTDSLMVGLMLGAVSVGIYKISLGIELHICGYRNNKQSYVLCFCSP